MNGTCSPRRGLIAVPAFDRVIGEILSDPFFAPIRAVATPSTTPAGGNLALDVWEEGQNVMVAASLPGFTKEQVAVSVEDGVLTIRAEQNTDQTSEDTNGNIRYLRRERRVGSYTRSISLPEDVLVDQIRGEMRDGVLTLTLPKSPRTEPRKVTIN